MFFIISEQNVKCQPKKKRGKLPSTKTRSDSPVQEYSSDDIDDFNLESKHIAIQKPFRSPSKDFNYDFPAYGAMDIHQSVEDSGHLSGYHKKHFTAEHEFNFQDSYEDQSSTICFSDRLNLKPHTRRKKSKSSTSTQASNPVKWDIDFDGVALNNSSRSDMEKTYDHQNVSFHHDHLYTSIHGNTFFNLSPDELAQNNNSIDKNSQIFTQTFKPLLICTPPFPFIYSPMLPYICDVKEVGTSPYSICSKYILMFNY